MDNQISSSNSVEQGEDVVIIEVNGGVEQQQSAAGRVSMNKKGKKKVKRGKRSQVWEYFDELGEGNDGKERAQLVFDPRYKLQFVEYSYKQLFGENSNEFEIAKECLYEMFNEYVKAFSKNTNTSEGSQQNNKGKKRLEDEQDDFMEGFDTYENEDSGAGEKSQLDLYLMEKRSPRTEELDILCFWKANQYRYPVLSLLARDVLSIPISTVASESAFSVGGRVIDQYRTALKSDTVEAIVCTRDWLGEKKDHKPSLNDLCEDVFKMHINHEVNQSTQCSNASQ